MDLKNINSKVENIDNQIAYYLSIKELYLENNISQNESIISEINFMIDKLYENKKILLNYIEKRLLILDEYEELERKIIFYKEETKEKYTWFEIANLVNYSETQCRNIYRKYKKQRYID